MLALRVSLTPICSCKAWQSWPAMGRRPSASLCMDQRNPESQDLCSSLGQGLAADWPNVRRSDSSIFDSRAYKGLLAGPQNGH